PVLSVAGALTPVCGEGSVVVVHAAPGGGSAVAAGAPVAARGLIVGDVAVGHCHRGPEFGEQAAALAFAAVGQGAPVAADDHVVRDLAIAESNGAGLIFDGPAPGVAALFAHAARRGDDVVAGQRT